MRSLPFSLATWTPTVPLAEQQASKRTMENALAYAETSDLTAGMAHFSLEEALLPILEIQLS